MSSTVLPHKRRGLYAYDDNMPEQTPEKRTKKIDDFPKVDRATKLGIVGKEFGEYCEICGCETDHSPLDCPVKSKSINICRKSLESFLVSIVMP
ncbi:hypothetical protein AgCh_015083 [Apium graveolens]